ncbi:MAG: GAP family protein [Mycobacterium sp.]
MWTSVLVLSAAVNFEPARPTAVTLMLTRPRPIAQLVALFLGCFLTGLIAGLLVLFVFHQTPLGADRANGARAQIIIGAVTVIAAGLAAWNRPWRKPDAEPSTTESGQTRAMDKFAERGRALLRKGRSPWLAFVLGMSLGLPSVDYLAVIIVIGSSGASPLEQVAALLTFLLLGNVFVVIPLVSFMVSPTRTGTQIQRFQGWIMSRTRQQVAAVVAVVGVIQILLGSATLWFAAR